MKRTGLGLIAVLTMTQAAWAQASDDPQIMGGPPAQFCETQKVFASDAAANDLFGYSISVSGDVAVVGAPNDIYVCSLCIQGTNHGQSCSNDNDCPGGTCGPCRGSAYVYRWNGASWAEEQKLTSPDVLDGFAGSFKSVSVSGDVIVVGAYFDNCRICLDGPNGGQFCSNDIQCPFSSCVFRSCGAAYVYRWNGTTWIEEQKLTASNPSQLLGDCVSVSGDVIVAGAPGAQMGNCPASDTCLAAYVFRYNGTSWIQEQKLTASALLSPNYAGSISVSGDVVVVGADGENSAYVYRWNGAMWIEEQKLTGEQGNDLFGFSVSVSGDVALVGANFNGPIGCQGGPNDGQPCSNNNDCPFATCGNIPFGSAYIFRWNGASWIEEQKLTASDAETGDVFSYSVSVSGDVAVIGANFDDCAAGGNDCGSAYVYQFNGASWVEEQKLTASDAEAQDRFGSCVAVSGDTALMGVFEHNCPVGGDDRCGSAYVYTLGGECPPPDPVGDPSGIQKARSLSISLPAATAAAVASETAIRVRLVSLHHVEPPYTGGASVPFTAFEGQVRWVGPPAQYVESTASGTPFMASALQCAPHYQDWSTVGLVHVLGSAIVPSSIYEVENVAASCTGSEGSCTAVSAPLTVNTTRWGDVEQPYNPPSATVQPDLGDVGALVNKFRSASGAPIKARALLAGDDAFGNINLVPDLNFGHIAACVDAFRGKPYPFTIQSCP